MLQNWMYRLLLCSFVSSSTGNVLHASASPATTATREDPLPTYSAWRYPVKQQALEETRSPLSKRGLCANAFGAGWIDNICNPSKTLCCVQTGQTFPQCQQALNVGWCCVSEDGGCYIDLKTPVETCEQPAAVYCESLAAGVSKACCPQYTTCASGYNASDTFARCNIQRRSLLSLDASSTTVALTLASSSSSTSQMQTTSSTSPLPATPTTSSATTITSPAVTSPPTSDSDLSTGAVSGIAVGAVASGLIAGALAAFLIIRKRRQRKRSAATSTGNYDIVSPTEPNSERPVRQREWIPLDAGSHHPQPFAMELSHAEMLKHELPGNETARGSFTPKPVLGQQGPHELGT